MNDYPITLKPEDSAPLPDPQDVAVELMALLRTVTDDATQLRDMVVGQRRAHARAHEVAETAARALDAGETLVQALRYARLFSADYHAT